MAVFRQAIAAKLILALTACGIAAAAALSAYRPSAPSGPPGRPAIPARLAPRSAPDRVERAAPAATPRPAAAASASASATPAAASAAMRIKRVLDIGPIKFGDFAWDTKGVPDGPVIITVDLAAQTLSVFRDGYEIGAAAILYGADDKPTPLGSFPILMKDAHHVSRTYGNAPMPFTLRLTADGVSVHGTEVAWGYATHGCIGVPTAFARLLFAQAKVGDRVIITRGKTLATGQQLVRSRDI